MANRTKVYYLCPTWDYAPDGPIQLGNIVMSADTVAEPLNHLHRNPPPATSLFPVSSKSAVNYSQEQRRKGKYGIWTGFLSVLGVGVDMGLEHESAGGTEFTFERIETVEFIPPDDYLQMQMSSQAVVNYIEKQRFQNSVFMVTAIKTVFGVTGKTEFKHSAKGETKVSLDGTIYGVAPVTIGPKVGGEKTSSQTTSFGASSNFVFAFRLRRVKVERKGRLVQRPETKGAMYDAEPTAHGRTVTFDVLGIAKEDSPDHAECQDHAINAFDDTDGEDCVCMMIDESE